jgi:hypothetical protein
MDSALPVHFFRSGNFIGGDGATAIAAALPALMNLEDLQLRCGAARWKGCEGSVVLGIPSFGGGLGARGAGRPRIREANARGENKSIVFAAHARVCSIYSREGERVCVESICYTGENRLNVA